MTDVFTGKVAIVTGGGRGLGKDIVWALARQGATVVIAARTMSHAEQTLRELSAAGHQACVFNVDVTCRESLRSLVTDTVARYGRLDIVVHNAADIPFSAIDKLTEDKLETCLSSVLKASFWLTQDAAPHLAQSGEGRLIFISSTCGPRFAMPGLVHYGTAKAGLNAFIAGAALELAGQGITVNGVEPGTTVTERLEKTLTLQQRQSIASRIPVPRLGTGEDIANAVCFLAASTATYITGQTIVVDGGKSKMNPLNIADLIAANKHH